MVRVLYKKPDTLEFAAQEAKRLLRRRKRSGRAAVFALYGNLGAGKTTFVQGFGKRMGIRRRMLSPTFVFMKRYAIHAASFRVVYHYDLYRMRSKNDAEHLFLPDALKDGRAIVLIEWPEKIIRMIPKPYRTIRFSHRKTGGRGVLAKGQSR